MPSLRPLISQCHGGSRVQAHGREPASPSATNAVSAPTAKSVRDPQKRQVRVGPSAIDGQGAFAGEPLPARGKIGEIRGEFIDLAEARERARAAERQSGRIFMVAISDKRAVDATASTDPLRFANHSCAPNVHMKVEQGRIALYALRDIAEGEELTVRYGPTHHGGRLVCRCGASRCVGRL